MNHRQKRRKRFRAREHQKTIQGAPRVLEYPDGTIIEATAGCNPRPSYHRSDPQKHGIRGDARSTLDRTICAAMGWPESMAIDDHLRREYHKLLQIYGGNTDQAAQGFQAVVKQRTGRDMGSSSGRGRRFGRNKATADQLQIDAATHGFSAVDEEGERVDPADIKRGIGVDMPEFERLDREKLHATVLGGGTFTLIDGQGHETEPIAYDASISEINRAADRAGITGHPTEAEWEEITATAKRRKRGVAKFAEKAGFTLAGEDLDPKERESWVRNA